MPRFTLEQIEEVQRQMNNVPQNNVVPQNTTQNNGTPRFTMEMIEQVQAQMNQAQNGVGVQSAPVSSVPTLNKPTEAKAKETKIEETKKIDLAERQKKKDDFQQRRIDKMSDGPVKQKDKKTGADVIGYTKDGQPIYDPSKFATDSLSSGGKATNINDSNASKLLSKDEYKNRKKKQASLNRDSEWASNHPVLATAEKVASSPIVGVGNIVENAYGLATGDSTGDKFARKRRSLEEGAKSNIGTNFGEGAYDLGTGLAEMALNATITGGGLPYGVLTGGQSAGDLKLDAIERGANERQASAFALGGGALSGYMNAKGLNAIDDALGKKAVESAGDVLRNIAIGSLAEGGENFIETTGQELLDRLINADSSNEAIDTAYAKVLA